MEMGDVRAACDEVTRSRASGEKQNKMLQVALNEVNKKVEESNLTLNDFTASKQKCSIENADKLRQLQELENNANMLNKVKNQLHGALEEIKRQCDDEAKERMSLIGKLGVFIRVGIHG